MSRSIAQGVGGWSAHRRRNQNIPWAPGRVGSTQDPACCSRRRSVCILCKSMGVTRGAHGPAAPGGGHRVSLGAQSDGKLEKPRGSSHIHGGSRGCTAGTVQRTQPNGNSASAFQLYWLIAWRWVCLAKIGSLRVFCKYWIISISFWCSEICWLGWSFPFSVLQHDRGKKWWTNVDVDPPPPFLAACR